MELKEEREYLELQVEVLKDLVSRVLSGERLKHTFEVADWAEVLARHHGLDPLKARCAGLVHDLAKQIPLKSQLRYARRWNLLKYPEDEQSPYVLHGPVAAYWLEHYYGLDDAEVIAAVANHTLGRPGMGQLEMLIYSADLTEPDRDFPKVDILRQSLYDNLEKGTLACVEHTLRYLKESKRPIHPLTQLTFDDLQRRQTVGTGSKNA